MIRYAIYYMSAGWEHYCKEVLTILDTDDEDIAELYLLKLKNDYVSWMKEFKSYDRITINVCKDFEEYKERKEYARLAIIGIANQLQEKYPFLNKDSRGIILEYHDGDIDNFEVNFHVEKITTTLINYEDIVK